MTLALAQLFVIINVKEVQQQQQHLVAAQLDALTDKLKVTTDAVTNAIKHLITLINLLGEGRVPNGLPLRKNAAKKE